MGEGFVLIGFTLEDGLGHSYEKIFKVICQNFSDIECSNNRTKKCLFMKIMTTCSEVEDMA